MNLESTSARADKRTFSEEIRRAVRAVNTANVAIYPVDARGLIGVFDMHPEFSPASNTRLRPGAPLKFAIQVPPRQVTLEQKDGRWTGSVEALFVQKSAEGKNLGGKSEIVHIRMGPENYQAVQQHGMVFNAELEIVPAAVELRVALRDNGSGAIGSVIIPFKGVTR